MALTQALFPFPPPPPLDKTQGPHAFLPQLVWRLLPMEEFQEAEILWPDCDREKDEEFAGDDSDGAQRKAPSGTGVKIPIAPPPAVSSWAMGFDYGKRGGDTLNDDSSDEDGGGKGPRRHMTPPHLIVDDRRMSADKMAFSVCVGTGRTLKGRDLSHVRNAVLRLTGFLEI